MKALRLMFIISIAIGAWSCSDNGNIEPEEKIPPRQLTTHEAQLVGSGNSFGLNLFKTVNGLEEKNKNIFISPLSVTMALGMTYNGAEKDTKTAMENTLGYKGLAVEDINKSYKSLIELFKGLDKNVQFGLANSIWHRLDMSPLPDFVNVNKTFFDAEVKGIDFGGPGAKDLINGWVEDKTNGKIEDILDFIPSDAVLYLINAIYFKAAWKYEFDKKKTYDGEFTTYSGERKLCKMMAQNTKFEYYANDKYQSVKLPYGAGDYCMELYLPSVDTDINSFIGDMCGASWEGWERPYKETEMTLYLPKFKLECNYLLNDALTAMGMDIAFDGERADFSKMFGSLGFYIGRVIHKTFVDVNEEGTEAAAATIVEIRNESTGTFMNMNRPFVFTIKENRSGTIMFMGKVVDL